MDQLIFAIFTEGTNGFLHQVHFIALCVSPKDGSTSLL